MLLVTMLEPDASRALTLDSAMRSRLADSLEYLDGFLKQQSSGGLTSVAVRGITHGQVVRASNIGEITGELDLLWTVSSSSRAVCTLKSSPVRLVALRRGTCRVGLRSILDQSAVLRNIPIR